jgi:MFS family permease
MSEAPKPVEPAAVVPPENDKLSEGNQPIFPRMLQNVFDLLVIVLVAANIPFWIWRIGFAGRMRKDDWRIFALTFGLGMITAGVRLGVPFLQRYLSRDQSQQFYCGTLKYTKYGLVAMFGWLLWGDFCFTLMEHVLPKILPLKLKDLGVSNAFISIVMTTIPGIMDIVVGAPVSYKSDRHRSKLGRRIPFILYTLPFLVVSLIMIGWSPDIGHWLQHVSPTLRRVTPATLTVVLIVIFVVSFHIFNNFVGCVYYYLFNDVVPPQYLGRFNGLFKIVGTSAGALYSFFLFQHSLDWFREIITGIALLYFVGVGIMCLRVKEGSYPPPPEEEKFEGFIGKLKSVGKETFTTRFYWFFYLTSACGALAGAIGVFGVFTNQQLNLTLKQQGILQAVGAIGGMIATYYAAVFVDRWHPLRISTYNAIGGIFGAYNGWIWLLITLPSAVMFWPSLIGNLAGAFSGALGGLCGIAMFMRLMPKSLYGQFSAANSIIRAVGGMVGGVLAGGFLDLVKWLLHNSDFAYRYDFVWRGTFSIAAGIFMCLAYREWLRLGGDEHYQAPAPWVPGGREPSAGKFKSVRSIPRWLRLAMYLGLLGLVMNLALMLFFTYEMYHHKGLHEIGHWHLTTWLPLKLWITAAGLVQFWHILRDCRAHERGEKTRFGLPHHGIWMVGSITGFAGFPAFWLKTQMLINMGKAYEIYILSIANLVGIILGTLSTQMIRWIERDVPESEMHPAVREALAQERAAAAASKQVSGA